MTPRDTVVERRSIDRSRRGILATCASALGGLAGCGGGGGQQDSDTPTQSPGTNPGGGDGGGNAAASGGGGTGGSCPDGFTYVAEGFSARGYDEAIGTGDVTESPRIQGGNLASMNSGFTAIAAFQDVLSGIPLRVDQYDWVDVTGRFDPSVSGTVIASSEDDLPASTWLVYDHPEGVLDVNVSNGGEGCPTASVEFFERLVGSQRPA